MFKIEFETDNAAFEWPHLSTETARILREIAAKLEKGESLGGGPVRDINGNTIGHWEMTPYGSGQRANNWPCVEDPRPAPDTTLA